MKFRLWYVASLLALMGSPAAAAILQFSCAATAPDMCFFSYDNGLRVTNFSLAAGQSYTLGGGRVGDPYVTFTGRQPPNGWPKCSLAAGCVSKSAGRGLNM